MAAQRQTTAIDWDGLRELYRMTPEQLQKGHDQLMTEYAALTFDVDWKHDPPQELVQEKHRMEEQLLNYQMVLSSGKRYLIR